MSKPWPCLALASTLAALWWPVGCMWRSSAAAIELELGRSTMECQRTKANLDGGIRTGDGWGTADNTIDAMSNVTMKLNPTPRYTPASGLEWTRVTSSREAVCTRQMLQWRTIRVRWRCRVSAVARVTHRGRIYRLRGA